MTPISSNQDLRYAFMAPTIVHGIALNFLPSLVTAREYLYSPPSLLETSSARSLRSTTLSA